MTTNGKMQHRQITSKHIALFEKIKRDMGRKKMHQFSVEKMLRKKGVPHNPSVLIAMDFIDWLKSLSPRRNDHDHL